MHIGVFLFVENDTGVVYIPVDTGSTGYCTTKYTVVLNYTQWPSCGENSFYV